MRADIRNTNGTRFANKSGDWRVSQSLESQDYYNYKFSANGDPNTAPGSNSTVDHWGTGDNDKSKFFKPKARGSSDTTEYFFIIFSLTLQWFYEISLCAPKGKISAPELEFG